MTCTSVSCQNDSAMYMLPCRETMHIDDATVLSARFRVLGDTAGLRHEAATAALLVGSIRPGRRFRARLRYSRCDGERLSSNPSPCLRSLHPQRTAKCAIGGAGAISWLLWCLRSVSAVSRRVKESGDARASDRLVTPTGLEYLSRMKMQTTPPISCHPRFDAGPYTAHFTSDTACSVPKTRYCS